MDGLFSRSTQDFGTVWANGMISPALKITSIHISLKNYSRGHNLLINPLHKESLRQ